VIDGGVYNERIVIDKPLILEGQNWPVIDGGGDGDVVTITSDDVTLSRFVVRNSGRNVSQEPAAVKIKDAHNATIQYNRIEQSHFGIHATGSHHATIAYNEIDAGNGVPQERRGHALYFWEVETSAVHGNTITNAADGIHLEFSHDNGIGENSVTNSRYALHFMTSHTNRVINNTFRDNLTGAIIMFSHDILLKGNELSNNRDGATGAGLLLKDVDNVFVQDNTIQRNKYGITAEGTPSAAGASATFVTNTLALNDVGIGLYPNAPITFVSNSMVENMVQVEAISGALDLGAEHSSGTTPEAGQASTAPVWTIGGEGNYWSDYNGYDADGDGIGDVPYEPTPAFGGAADDNPTLNLFQFTIAQEAIDAATEMFPVYEYDAIMLDTGPLMTPPGPAIHSEEGVNTGLIIAGVLLLVLAGAILQLAADRDPISVLLGGVRRVLPSRGQA
jgi:nitrous oxidase accessory protein